MSTDPKHQLLTADNSVLVAIDYQPQMLFGVQSHDRQTVLNNVLGLLEGAKTHRVPTVLTAVESKGFSGFMDPRILDVFPENKLFERTSMNTWEDEATVAEIKRHDRPKLIFTALWSEVCLTFPVLDAMAAGHECYFVTDSSAGTSTEAHEMAIQRMIQAGAVPVTWIQTVLEWQRDWAKKDTYDGTLQVMKDHGGAYGQGVEYSATHVHGLPPSRKA